MHDTCLEHTQEAIPSVETMANKLAYLPDSHASIVDRYIEIQPDWPTSVYLTFFSICFLLNLH